MTKENKYKLYVLREPDTGEIRYVGVTCQSLNRRLRKHCTDLNYACHRVTWIKSLKSRELTPEMELLRVFDDKEDCIKAVCLGRNKSTKNLTFKYIKE